MLKRILRRWRKSVYAMSSLAILVVAGCQNSADLQKALLTSFNTYSYESAEMFTLELELNERLLAKLPKDEQQFYRTFQQVDLTIADHIRVGRDKESIVGMLEFAGGSIPFTYSRNGNESALYVDGAQKPIVFNKDAQFKLDQIEVTEAEIGPAPAGISKEKKAQWSPKFSLIYSGAAMPSGIQTNGWLPGGTMNFKSSDYDIWRSKRIDEIRLQKKRAMQPARPGYGQWIVDLKDTLEKMESSIGDLAFYALRNTPLPQSTAIDDVIVEIGGKQEQVKRLRFQADGGEMAGMLLGMLQGFAKNKDELKEVAGSLYDLSTAYNVSRLELLREIDPDGEETAALRNYLGDRKQMVDALYGELASIVDDTISDTDPSSGQGDASSILNAAMNFEFYYQYSTGRAAGLEMYIPLPSGDESPFSGLKLSYTMQRWNVGDELPLKAIDLSKGKLDYFQSDGSLAFASPNDLLQFFDPKSDMYRLLEAIHLDGVDVDFPVENETLQAGDRPGREGARAYIEDGVTLVPLRFVSEQLYADVKWNGEKQEVTITSDGGDRVIVLTIGSGTAYVDGKPMKLLTAPALSPSGKTYVPIRFIAESLGAEVTWDEERRRVGVKK